ncbi:hypothetical protein ACRAWD_22605 [Caulobacter segnis]
MSTAHRPPRAADAYPAETVDKTAAANGRDAIIDTYLQAYDVSLGSVDGGDDVSSLLTAFQTALTNLASSSTASTKAAAMLGRLPAWPRRSARCRVRSVAAHSGQQRDRRDRRLDQFHALDAKGSERRQIVSTQASGGDAGDLEEDQRAAAGRDPVVADRGDDLHHLQRNRVMVYTTGGQQLLGTAAACYAYDASSALSASATYPGSVSGDPGQRPGHHPLESPRASWAG